MIKNWESFKRINEDINWDGFKKFGFYRVDEQQMESIIEDLTRNGIDFQINDNNYIVIETFDYEKPFQIITNNGGIKLSLSLEDADYEHDAILLRSKPINVPQGAYM